ncbi:MAG: hypothetical protein N3B13_03400, partial [Deltaproteobacteria bacterium]|nr:hypothetical protein [Deltaproteobacteria bacterium]
HTVAHIIIGLMNDGEDDLRKLALWLSEKNVSGVKIHNIVVLRDTVLGDRFFQGEFSPPSRERLLELYRIFFESIRHNIVVHRLITDADKRFIIAPEYALDKNSLIRDVRKVTEAIL